MVILLYTVGMIKVNDASKGNKLWIVVSCMKQVITKKKEKRKKREE